MMFCLRGKLSNEQEGRGAYIQCISLRILLHDVGNGVKFWGKK